MYTNQSRQSAVSTVAARARTFSQNHAYPGLNLVLFTECLCLCVGIVDEIDYVPGSGRQLLAKNASLQLCDAAACKPTKVTVTVKLDASQDSSNSRCEVDAESIAARNQFCGMSLEMSEFCLMLFCDVLQYSSIKPFLERHLQETPRSADSSNVNML